jgi:hypothetical protein
MVPDNNIDEFDLPGHNVVIIKLIFLICLRKSQK